MIYDVQPDAAGTLYFGFDASDLKQYDELGVQTDENRIMISVSQSGYRACLPCDIHPEIDYLAREIYIRKYNAAVLHKKHLHWKKGYKNSLTYLDGFGACDRESYNCFGKEMPLDGTEKITAVIASEHSDLILQAEDVKKKCHCLEEYYSLALHTCTLDIPQQNIKGWIVNDSLYNKILQEMKNGILRKRPVWKISRL